MTLKAWTYLIFIVTLTVLFAGIIIYYYWPSRKDRVERPKDKMLEDDEKEG